MSKKNQIIKLAISISLAAFILAITVFAATATDSGSTNIVFNGKKYVVEFNAKNYALLNPSKQNEAYGWMEATANTSDNVSFNVKVSGEVWSRTTSDTIGIMCTYSNSNSSEENSCNCKAVAPVFYDHYLYKSMYNLTSFYINDVCVSELETIMK